MYLCDKVTHMKQFCLFLAVLLLLTVCGCTLSDHSAPILATTRPVYDLTTALCDGTDLEVSLLINENVSCLHDYSLSTNQMKNLENAEMVIMSGAGLEEFQTDILIRCNYLLDASKGVTLIECQEGHDHDGHSHDQDAHIWLAPKNAKIMATNICKGLQNQFPAQTDRFQHNLETLLSELDKLQAYGEETLKDLSCRELITFHDGFSYLAQAFDLTILAAVEEESGSEASAKELISLIEKVRHHNLPAVFNETNGSPSASSIISAETGVNVFTLDMCMGDGTYIETMYQNINTLKEALG